MDERRRYVVLTEGFITDRHAKTAFGVMRYGRDNPKDPGSPVNIVYNSVGPFFQEDWTFSRCRPGLDAKRTSRTAFSTKYHNAFVGLYLR